MSDELDDHDQKVLQRLDQKRAVYHYPILINQPWKQLNDANVELLGVIPNDCHVESITFDHCRTEDLPVHCVLDLYAQSRNGTDDKWKNLTGTRTLYTQSKTKHYNGEIICGMVTPKSGTLSGASSFPASDIRLVLNRIDDKSKDNSLVDCNCAIYLMLYIYTYPRKNNKH